MNFVSSKHQTVTLSASDVVAAGHVARFANIFCIKLNAFVLDYLNFQIYVKYSHKVEAFKDELLVSRAFSRCNGNFRGLNPAEGRNNGSLSVHQSFSYIFARLK